MNNMGQCLEGRGEDYYFKKGKKENFFFFFLRLINLRKIGSVFNVSAISLGLSLCGRGGNWLGG